MLRFGKDRSDRPALYNLTELQHDYLVAVLRNYRQVVGDQKQCLFGDLSRLRYQVENLALHRDVERSRRFVGNQKRRRQ